VAVLGAFESSDGGGWAGAIDRLRQYREPSAGEVDGAGSRTFRPASTWRGAFPINSAIVDGKLSFWRLLAARWE